MATYTIIGGDQKEYGSVTADDLRKWITDGRLNAQSLAKEEHDTEFRPLSAFPEFADVLGASSAPAPPLTAPLAPAGDGRDAALQMVKGPAIGLKATAILGLFLVVVGLVVNILTLSGFHFGLQQMYDPQMQKFFNSLGGGLGIVQNIIGGIVGVIVLLGAAKMQKLQNYQFALTASIVAMVPCISPCCVFGLPFGIWALVVLNKPEVKSQFG
ncbi:MAG: hypothetical protein ACLP2Y_17190 [Limisphaerales bacterium]|jgi:hypothetical protein